MILPVNELGWLVRPSHYQLLGAAVLLELALIQLQLVWLLLDAIRSGYARRKGAALSDELDEWLEAILRGARLEAVWVRRVRRYPCDVVRAQLTPLLLMTSGNARRSLETLYRSAGLLAEDIALSRSYFWGRRLLGIRRLSLVANAREIPVLLERGHDRYVIQALCARILARVAAPSQLLCFLAKIRIPKRLMEQPLAAALGSATIEQIDLLLSRIAMITDQRVRRLILVSAAQIAPAKCLEVLLSLPQELDKEARITSCVVAERLPAKDLAPLVLRGLTDPAFEVRTHAARACARLMLPELMPSLDRALEDPVFWVRQSAARALTAQGARGRQHLRQVAEAGRDRFAANTARQELEHAHGAGLQGAAP